MTDSLVPDPDVAYWLEMTQVRASRDQVEATIQHMPGNPLKLAFRNVGGGVALMVGSEENPFLNRVVGLGVERPASIEDLNAAISFFDVHGRKSVGVAIAPQARPSELIGWVEQRGFSATEGSLKLWRPLDSLPEPRSSTLRIESIDRDQAGAFASIAGAALGFSARLGPMMSSTVGRRDWAHYLGFDGDVPVAAGAMYVVGEFAWLGFGATLASHRGMGGQSAILQRRLADAKAAGCRLALTETGLDSAAKPNHSYRNMIRLGFGLAYRRRTWVRMPRNRSCLLTRSS